MHAWTPPGTARAGAAPAAAPTHPPVPLRRCPYRRCFRLCFRQRFCGCGFCMPKSQRTAPLRDGGESHLAPLPFVSLAPAASCRWSLSGGGNRLLSGIGRGGKESAAASTAAVCTCIAGRWCSRSRHPQWWQLPAVLLRHGLLIRLFRLLDVLLLLQVPPHL